MPVYESSCLNEGCPRQDHRFEWYASTMSNPDPDCESCGLPTHRMVSNFSPLWTGTLDRFNTPGREKFNEADGGHFAFRIRSTRHIDGSPERVLLRTHAEQAAFCREEGLMRPDDVPPNVEVGEDGISFSAQGQKGSWGDNPASMPQGEPTRARKEKPVFSGAW